ncbi:hypothetical protein MIMGU_mgv11b014413mg [Erythranthe guttata]|uniref:Uncharacterized protein n=1 Tax=Erythranthe guttata TaxID=4155 RepID=A0A022RPT1_ERYGU|nr:hypothetical protein MIMGU_mgv11b014413mg [Erythranthe guttata]
MEVPSVSNTGSSPRRPSASYFNISLLYFSLSILNFSISIFNLSMLVRYMSSTTRTFSVFVIRSVRHRACTTPISKTQSLRPKSVAYG